MRLVVGAVLILLHEPVGVGLPAPANGAAGFQSGLSVPRVWPHKLAGLSVS